MALDSTAAMPRQARPPATSAGIRKARGSGQPVWSSVRRSGSRAWPMEVSYPGPSRGLPSLSRSSSRSGPRTRARKERAFPSPSST
eukprot:7193679-Heterocapsa_arctica.AAC.1